MAKWSKKNPDQDRVILPLEQFTTLRGFLLGREAGLPPTDDDRAAYNHVQQVGELDWLVAQWLESDEFVVNWPRSRAFARVQQTERIPPPEETRTVVHIHVPKTAGTTLNSVFGSHFAPTETFYQRPLSEFLALPIGRMLSLRFIAGHFAATVVDLIDSRDPFVVTMIREPAEHLASLRRYLIREGKFDPSISLVDWLRAPDAPVDYQALRLVTDFRLGSELGTIPEGTFPDRDMSRLRDDVAERLERVDIAAPHERVHDVYLAMCEATGIEPHGFDEFPVMNPTYDEEITDHVRELVAEIAPTDTWLYNLVTATARDAAVGPVRVR